MVALSRPWWLTERLARALHRMALELAAESGETIREVLTDAFGRETADKLIEAAAESYRRKRP